MKKPDDIIWWGTLGLFLAGVLTFIIGLVLAIFTIPETAPKLICLGVLAALVGWVTWRVWEEYNE